MTDAEAARVLREMRDGTKRVATSYPKWVNGKREIAALTAALAALDGTRLKQDAERMETQRAQYAHLALKHDATEKRLTAALEDQARLRERIEALPVRDLADVFQTAGHAAHLYVNRAAVLDAIDAGEPPKTKEEGTMQDITALGDQRARCCFIDPNGHPTACDRLAEWAIVHGRSPDNVTEACTAHVGELLTDAPEHRVYRLGGAAEGGDTGDNRLHD